MTINPYIEFIVSDHPVARQERLRCRLASYEFGEDVVERCLAYAATGAPIERSLELLTRMERPDHLGVVLLRHELEDCARTTLDPAYLYPVHLRGAAAAAQPPRSLPSRDISDDRIEVLSDRLPLQGGTHTDRQRLWQVLLDPAYDQQALLDHAALVPFAHDDAATITTAIQLRDSYQARHRHLPAPEPVGPSAEPGPPTGPPSDGDRWLAGRIDELNGAIKQAVAAQRALEIGTTGDAAELAAILEPMRQIGVPASLRDAADPDGGPTLFAELGRGLRSSPSLRMLLAELLQRHLPNLPPDPTAELRRLRTRFDTLTRDLADLTRPAAQPTTAHAEAIARMRGQLVAIRGELATAEAAQTIRTRYLIKHEACLVRAIHAARDLERRTDAALRRVVATPPGYLVGVLGRPPADPDGRATWQQAAHRIEQYRADHRIDDLTTALGPEPADPAQRILYHAVTTDLTNVRGQLAARPHGRRRAGVDDPHPDAGGRGLP